MTAAPAPPRPRAPRPPRPTLPAVVLGVGVSGLLVVGCRSADQGTVVGNPGDSLVQTAPSARVVWTAGTAAWVELELEPCVAPSDDGDDGEEEVEADGPFDLLGGESIEIPGGTWCELTASLGEVELAGTLDTDDGLEIWLDDVEIELTARNTDVGLVVDGQQLILELAHPDWLEDMTLAEPDEGVVTLDDAGSAFASAVERVTDGSGMFEDADADDTLSDDERSDGAVLVGAARPSGIDGEADDGDNDTGSTVMSQSQGGCGNTEFELAQAGAVGLLWLPLCGLRRRRR